jgi:hypothetical protein
VFGPKILDDEIIDTQGISSRDGSALVLNRTVKTINLDAGDYRLTIRALCPTSAPDGVESFLKIRLAPPK